MRTDGVFGISITMMSEPMATVRAVQRQSFATEVSELNILMLDTEEFSLADLEAKPIGGAQLAFVELARAFEARGHKVMVRNNCSTPGQESNLDWQALDSGIPEAVDFVIANRQSRLLGVVSHPNKFYGSITQLSIYFAGRNCDT